MVSSRLIRPPLEFYLNGSFLGLLMWLAQAKVPFLGVYSNIRSSMQFSYFTRFKCRDIDDDDYLKFNFAAVNNTEWIPR